MQFKHEFFFDGTEAYKNYALPHKKRDSGYAVGEMVAEHFGHTVLDRTDGEKIYKLEFVAFPIAEWHRFMRNLEIIMLGDPALYGKTMEAIRELDTPQLTTK